MSVVAVQVYTYDKTLSFHVASFTKWEHGIILALNESWGDDGKAPQWRLDKKVGVSISDRDRKGEENE